MDNSGNIILLVVGAKGIGVFTKLNSILERISGSMNFLVRPGKLLFDRKNIIKFLVRVTLEMKFFL